MKMGKIDFRKIYEQTKHKNTVKPDEELVRYMNFPKLISLLETKALFLSISDVFEDVDEGLFPSSHLNISIEGGQNDGEKPQLNQLILPEHVKNAKRSIFINSWNILKSESYALWKIYGEKFGVAIQTDFQRLEALAKFKGALIRKVNYIDDDSFFINASTNENPMSVLEFFKLKKKYYSYEEEVRIILFDDSPAPSNTIQIDNIENLISKIYVSPFAEKWFVELVTTVVRQRYGLNIDVIRSGIKINK